MNEIKPPIPMVSVSFEPEYRILIEESCGIAHESQILPVALPQGSETKLLLLSDRRTGRTFPLQASQADPKLGFLQIEIAPWEKLELGPLSGIPDAARLVELQIIEDAYRIANRRLVLKVARSGSRAPNDSFPSGPVLGVQLFSEGVWRGRSFFDTQQPLRQWEITVVEEGPLRVVLRYEAWFGNAESPSYTAALTLDTESDFVRVEEHWQGNSPGDQLVWDFAGNDLPLDLLRLDSTPGCAVEPFHYLFDRRLCRLFAWTQMSQLSDLSDGYALAFERGEAIGFVTQSGGDWRGNRLNHLEAWARRWVGNDPASRRNVPDGAKRDANPSPERIPGRGGSRTTPHLNIEGWIGETGSRSWALVVARTADLLPGAGATEIELLDRGCAEGRRHFELTPDRETDRRQSSRLRRIHTQYGLLPLSVLADTVFCWEAGTAASTFVYPHPVIDEHLRHRDQNAPSEETVEEREERRKIHLFDSLAARVYGFWEGGGCASANPVVSRDIAPRMLQFEYLVQTGKLTPEEQTMLRARFAFLLRLFRSDNYYPGMATMLPVEHPDSVEPTLEGMANQNFYTDVVNIPGIGAQVFPGHPDASLWSRRFGEHWARQLEYHVYPKSGVWEESHTYFQHVLSTVLPTLLRRRDDGSGDAFADQALQGLVRGAIRQVTPRDGRFENARYMAPFGDHSAGHHSYYRLYKPLAEAFAAHDAELAGQLSWMYREMGGKESVTVVPVAPPLTSESVEGLGYFLRGTDDVGKEFLLALRAGSAWGHHHQDEGSIQVWAKGRSRIVDAGFGEWAAGARKFNDSGHSRWALTDFPSMNYLYRFNRGWITAHQDDGLFPYAVAHTPIYLQNPAPQTVCPLPSGVSAMHRRAIVRIGDCAFLIVDVAETSLKQTVHFHVPAEESTTYAAAKEGVVVHCEDDCRLSLLSVLSGQAPLAVTGGDPLPAGKATTEISAAAMPESGRSCAVYLLAADHKKAEMPVIQQDGNIVFLTGNGFSVQLKINGHRLRLTDVRSHNEQTIDLSPPGRFVG